MISIGKILKLDSIITPILYKRYNLQHDDSVLSGGCFILSNVTFSHVLYNRLNHYLNLNNRLYIRTRFISWKVQELSQHF